MFHKLPEDVPATFQGMYENTRTKDNVDDTALYDVLRKIRTETYNQYVRSIKQLIKGYYRLSFLHELLSSELCGHGTRSSSGQISLSCFQRCFVVFLVKNIHFYLTSRTKTNLYHVSPYHISGRSGLVKLNDIY